MVYSTKTVVDTLLELEFQVIIHIISYNSEPEQAHTQFSYNYIAYMYIIMFMRYIMHISSSLVRIS
jgi:hypothetical protein